MVGCERSWNLAQAVASRGQETLVCDALALPYRDESLDAALSVAVIHHLASTERRVQALRELSRVLRVGGRVLITVWAMEQAHRKVPSRIDRRTGASNSLGINVGKLKMLEAEKQRQKKF